MHEIQRPQTGCMYEIVELNIKIILYRCTWLNSTHQLWMYTNALILSTHSFGKKHQWVPKHFGKWVQVAPSHTFHGIQIVILNFLLIAYL